MSPRSSRLKARRQGGLCAMPCLDIGSFEVQARRRTIARTTTTILRMLPLFTGRSSFTQILCRNQPFASSQTAVVVRDDVESQPTDERIRMSKATPGVRLIQRALKTHPPCHLYFKKAMCPCCGFDLLLTFLFRRPGPN